ncbi:hypothetical protein PZA11_006525 [Diplocarpon coronariae]
MEPPPLTSSGADVYDGITLAAALADHDTFLAGTNPEHPAFAHVKVLATNGDLDAALGDRADLAGLAVLRGVGWKLMLSAGDQLKDLEFGIPDQDTSRSRGEIRRRKGNLCKGAGQSETLGRKVLVTLFLFALIGASPTSANPYATRLNLPAIAFSFNSLTPA